MPKEITIAPSTCNDLFKSDNLLEALTEANLESYQTVRKEDYVTLKLFNTGIISILNYIILFFKRNFQIF